MAELLPGLLRRQGRGVCSALWTGSKEEAARALKEPGGCLQGFL